MGSIVGGAVAQGMCCCFSCCCKDCSEGILKWLGPTKSIKMFYIFLVVIFVVPSIFVFFFLHKWESFLNYFSTWISCPSLSGGSFECIGSSIIYRLSLSLLCLFGLMLLLTLCRCRLGMVLNEGCFFAKYIFVSLLFVGSLFLPNTVFSNYGDASLYISIAYMILQSIVLIDLFYLGGIKLVKKYDEGASYMAGVLIALFVVLQSLAILLNVLGYIWFPSSNQCGNTLWVNIVTSCIIVALPLLQMLHFNSQNSLVTTSLVSIFVSYLSFISQFSYGNSTCVRITPDSLAFDIAISTIIFILSMYGSIMGGSGQVKPKEPQADSNGEVPINSTPVLNKEGNYSAPDHPDNELANMKSYEDWSWAKWHFYMSLGAIYVGMLITNWTSSSIITGQLMSNDLGFWVRLVIGWATTALYIWTLIAPRIFPERDFVVE